MSTHLTGWHCKLRSTTEGGAHKALPITFSQDLIAHAGCWRPAVSWLQARYPTFFEPNETAAATATAVFGTASYADSRGSPDMDAVGAAHYKKMGYMMNWDSSARFPWHGARFSAEIYTRGCHWFPRLLA
jgi:hypothetical protein